VQVDGGQALRANPRRSPNGSTAGIAATFVDGTPLPTGTRVDRPPAWEPSTRRRRRDGAASTTLRGDDRRGTAKSRPAR
jgi:hypothetical protein